MHAPAAAQSRSTSAHKNPCLRCQPTAEGVEAEAVRELV